MNKPNELNQKTESVKTITGVFTKQVWGGRKGDDAIYVGDVEFEATEAVLQLPHSQLIELQDGHESTDEIGRKIVMWDGPCEVRLVDSIATFFGVDSLEDVSAEMLNEARQDNARKASSNIVHCFASSALRIVEQVCCDFDGNGIYSVGANAALRAMTVHWLDHLKYGHKGKIISQDIDEMKNQLEVMRAEIMRRIFELEASNKGGAGDE